MCTEAPLIKALMKISDKIQLARANPTAASRICQAPANKDKLETMLTALMVALSIDTYFRTIDPASMHTRAFVPKKIELRGSCLVACVIVAYLSMHAAMNQIVSKRLQGILMCRFQPQADSLQVGRTPFLFNSEHLDVLTSLYEQSYQTKYTILLMRNMTIILCNV